MSSQENKLENKAYSHEEVESKWTKEWCEKHIYKTQINSGNKTFSIVLPPPNVTGELHMGHALSGTFQDVLIRYNRMLGKDVLWQIGTDHAGIGTQIVVEKFLKKEERITRHELGREKFVERVKDWKDDYGNRILGQMKKLGFSPDWDRCRYTMDDHYAKQVKFAFKKYFDEGLIYRGKRVVNWCPKCKTSLSDLEIKKQIDKKKKLYHLKYPIKDTSEFIVVATTRPETMFGDTGVAAHPEDERYTDKIGKSVLLPLVNREIPIVGDEHAKAEFGTGALKVTPAHDANDFEIAQRQNLEKLIVMDEDAKMLAIEEVPEYLHGLDRYEARAKTMEELEKHGFVQEVSEYEQEKDLHDRCDTEIEPYLSDQWYVNMDHEEVKKNLSRIALDTVGSGKSQFIPKRYETIFKNWLENIRDWCISRQIWWGHRIPVFYYKDEAFKEEKGHYPYFVDLEHDLDKGDSFPEKDPVRNIDLKDFIAKGDIWQDEDVLDTWFSSALWPFETLKSSNGKDETMDVFNHFYPTNVLATAREIINLWVSRMIYSSEFFENKEPYKDILIHPVVQTPDGKRMSKSKGNAIDPLEMVDQYGADASRMWYASVGVYGPQDVRFPGKFDKSKKKWSSDTLEQYRKFANKLFNASKFVMMNLGEDFKPKKIEELDKSKLNMADKWILDKFHSLLDEINGSENSKGFYDEYDFQKIVNGIYEFLWFSFCDWYIELSKAEVKEETKQILFHVLEASLRVLHPIMPFITEELWQVLKSNYDFSEISDYALNSKANSESIAFARFPDSKSEFLAEDSESKSVDHLINVISSLRNIRQSLGISWSNEIKVFISTEDKIESQSIKAGEHYIKQFAKASELNLNSGDAEKPSHAVIIQGTKLSVPLAGLVDIEKVQESAQKKIASLEKDIGGLQGRLKSENFVKNAAPEKVQETKEQLEALLEKKSLYEDELANLN